MRKFFAPLFAPCLSFLAFVGQRDLPIQVQFDQRVEIVSIIFYLAGNKEYAECNDAAYLKDVDQHLGVYRSHPAVKMAADLREHRHVWFGSPVSLAVHLTPQFQLLPGTRDHAGGGSLDFRWALPEAQSFARQVQGFDEASGAREFFEQHEPLYRELTRRVAQLAAQLHPKWFASLAKTHDTRQFSVIPSLLVGNGNYGPHTRTDGGIRSYAIIGVWKFENDGSPAFGDDSKWIIIHEFAHAYVNPWVDQGMTGLRPAGEALIKAKQSDFARTRYGEGNEFSPVVLYETMVRALVVVYFADRGDYASSQRQLQKDVHSGWTWLPSVVDWVKAVRVRGSFHLDERARRDYGDLLTAFAQK